MHGLGGAVAARVRCLPVRQVWCRLARGLLGALTAACLIAGVALPAAAQSGTFSCDVTSVLDRLITSFPGGSGITAQEICGVESLENAAYNTYMIVHGYTPGSLQDPAVTHDLKGQATIAGYMFGLLMEVAYDQANDPAALTPDEQGAVQWLQRLVGQGQVLAAQDAINEYNAWNAAPCAYAPPNTTLFTWNSFLDDPACGGTLESLFSSNGPTYTQFLEFGAYDAAVAASSVPADETVVQDDITEGVAGFGALVTGVLPAIVNAANPGALTPWVNEVFPNLQKSLQIQAARGQHAKFLNEQANNEAVAEEDAGDVPAGDTEVATEAGTGATDAADAGIDASSEAVSSLGASAFTGPAFIAGIAIAIAVSEAQQVIQQSEIPGQLQSNLTSVQSAAPSASYIESLLTDSSGVGYTTVLADFESQVNLPVAANGPAAPPSDGTVFKVEVRSAATGQTLSTAYYPTLQMATWPVGLTASYPPFETFAVADGKVWHTPNPDQAGVGLSGYLTSGSLHYYSSAAGGSAVPRMAVLDGNQFLDLPSPGTIDQAGSDTGDECASGDCYTTTVLQIPISDLSITQQGASPYNDTYYQVSLVHDPGTPPGQEIVNQYGQPANSKTGGYPNGGLIAGQTVQLFDPAVNVVGIPTTYTWQVETRCAYDPTEPPTTIDGIPVCAGSPGYVTGHLPTNEQDLIVNGSEDPAFHGNPVATLLGQSVSFTWPAPGTYHVRLITSDPYGVTQQSDEHVTVAPTATTAPLTAVPGFTSVSAVGPVPNGSTFSITGCIDNPAAAYGNPQVSVNWGDGTTDTQSGQGGGDAGLSFHHGGTGLCASPWSFTATHAYHLTDPNNALQIGEPVTLTVNDGFGDSVTDNLDVNVSFATAPAITSANAATFTAGSVGSFTVAASGTPTPTLSLESGSLPSGVGFEPQGNGTALITGAATAAEAGAFPLTIAASSSAGTRTQAFTLDVDAAPTITSPSSGTLTVGAPGSLTFTAAGYPTPGLSLSGTVPADLTFASSVTFNNNGTATATLSGTPTSTDTGTYDLVLKATSGTGTASHAFTLTVSSLPSFTSADTAGWTTCSTNGQGQQVGYQTFDITATGSPQPNITLTGGTLPTGLTFYDTAQTGQSYAQISGCTSDGGTFPVTLTAANASVVNQVLTINVSLTGGPALTFSGNAYSSSQGAALFYEGQSGDSVTITSSDATAAIAETGALPAGLTFTDNGNGTATISGTPAAGSAGSYGLRIQSTGNGLAFLTVDVFGPPRVTSPSTAVFDVGLHGSFTVTTGGLPLATLTLSGALPAGLTFTANADGTATVAGTPTQGTVGSHSVTIKATNVAYADGSPTSTLQTVTSTLTIDVDQAPAFTSTNAAGFDIGAPGTFAITTTGVPAPALTLSGTLPAGITFDDNGDGTGTFLGTVPAGTSPASFPLKLTATSPGGSASMAFTLNVGPQPSFASLPTATFAVGSAGSFTIDAAGTPAPTLTESGSLPAGLTFADNGNGTATLAGTPQAGDGGASTVQVTATTAYGAATQNLAVVVDEAPTFVGTAAPTCASTAAGSSQAFVVGAAGSWILCTAGYPQPALSLQGALPSGVTFTDNGDGSATLRGTPAAGTAGVYPLVLTMSSIAGNQTQALTLNADEQIPPPSTELFFKTWVAGQVYSYTYTASVWPEPSFSLGPTAPSWLTLTDHGDGIATLSGTPPVTAVGTRAQFAMLENNGVGSQQGLAVSIIVPRMGFAAATPPGGTVGQPYAYSFVVTDPNTLTPTDPNATFALASGSLPPGLTLSPSGVVSGTPTTVGQSTFSVMATDGAFSETTSPIAVTVAAAPHTLEIAQFRLSGPAGPNDWFVQVYNTTSVALPLASWHVGISRPSFPAPALVPLGSGSIAPHGTVTLAGPYFSLSSALPPAAYGPPGSPSPGGVEIVAPDGTVTDVVGEVGAPAALIAGTGLTPPTPTAAQEAFVRDTSGGVPVDTGDNAADFTYGPVVGHQGPILASIAPGAGQVGTPVVLSGSGFGTVAGAVYFSQGGTTLQQVGTDLTWTSDTSVSTTVPDGLPPGSVSVAVYNPSTGLSNSVDFSVTAAAPTPTLASISPEQGPVGTPLTLLGSGFGTVAGAVYFTQGGTTLQQVATDVTWTSDTSVSTTVPAGLSPGSVSVAVYNPSTGLSNAVTFTVATATPPPASAAGAVSIVLDPSAVAPGGSVTVSGAVYGATGDPLSGAAVDVTVGVGTPLTVTSDVYGAYSTRFQAPATPGAVTVTAAVYGASAQTILLVTPPGVPAPAIDVGSGQAAIPGLTATGAGGAGEVEVADYTANPGGAPTFEAGGAYFDVALAPGYTFTSLTLSRCGAGAGQRLYWWNGTAWSPVTDPVPSFDAATGCLDVTLTASSSPTVADLTATPFALGTPYPISGGGGAPRYTASPTVTAISPASGPAAGGTLVEITGTNFYTPATVEFGTSAAADVTVQSSTRIEATAPAGHGTVDVTVTTSSGTSATGAADRFTYTGGAACGSGSQATASFPDVPASHWAYQEVETLACRGIVTGFPNGSFRPDGQVTRAQFVKMLVLTLGLKPGSGQTPFADVHAADWFAPYVATAVHAGIVRGLSPSSFGPGETITREQMAVMLARALKLTKTATLRFKDAATIDGWALQGVEEAVAAGYINGFPDGTLEPLGTTTRAQAAKVLALVLQGQASPGTTGSASGSGGMPTS